MQIYKRRTRIIRSIPILKKFILYKLPKMFILFWCVFTLEAQGWNNVFITLHKG